MAFEAKLRISIQHYISVTVGNRHRSPQVSQKNLSRIRKKMEKKRGKQRRRRRERNYFDWQISRRHVSSQVFNRCFPVLTSFGQKIHWNGHAKVTTPLQSRMLTKHK